VPVPLCTQACRSNHPHGLLLKPFTLPEFTCACVSCCLCKPRLLLQAHTGIPGADDESPSGHINIADKELLRDVALRRAPMVKARMLPGAHAVTGETTAGGCTGASLEDSALAAYNPLFEQATSEHGTVWRTQVQTVLLPGAVTLPVALPSPGRDDACGKQITGH
jgi:hypothetical protein